MGSFPSLHSDFEFYLGWKEGELIDLYRDIREFITSLNPTCVELIYNTHALTSVYSFSEKLSDAYSMIPIYTKHLNLGFNKGAILSDQHKLLQGTGKLMRHIPIKQKEDYRNPKVKSLIEEAILLAKNNIKKDIVQSGYTVSKIKR